MSEEIKWDAILAVHLAEILRVLEFYEGENQAPDGDEIIDDARKILERYRESV